MTDQSTEVKNEDKEQSLLGTLGRIALIFFAGFTIFLVAAMTMLIFLTKPTREYVMPDVTGKRYLNVHNSLARKSLKPEIKFKNVSDLDSGIILGQFPPKGEIVKENSSIKLIVSRSGINIPVPTLVGSELPMAINKLRNLHYQGRTISISTGIISYIPTDKDDNNIVIGQSPAKGETITPDQKINLLVSSGKVKANKRMPAVAGQSISLAYDLLASKKVIIYEKFITTYNIKNSGKIASQYPKKGAYLKDGSAVTLNIYHYPMKDHPYSAVEKISIVLPTIQKQGKIEAIVEDSRSKRVRFSRTLKPGARIEFLFERIGNAKITLLNNKKSFRVIAVNVDEYK